MSKRKNLDDKDVVFVNEPWTEEERSKFSAFLKAQKLRLQPRKQTKTLTTRTKKHYA